MRLVIDELYDDTYGPYYIDVVVSIDELEKIKLGEMVNTMHNLNGKRFYVGVIKQGRENYEENISEEESRKDSERLNE